MRYSKKYYIIFLSIYNMEDEPLTFYSVIQYIRENIIGLLLLIFVIFIIYFVDYINHLNTLLYSMPSPIPGFTNSTPLKNVITNNKHKKFKK